MDFDKNKKNVKSNVVLQPLNHKNGPPQNSINVQLSLMDDILKSVHHS
jgi:hypothetical protein